MMIQKKMKTMKLSENGMLSSTAPNNSSEEKGDYETGTIKESNDENDQ